MAGIRVRPYPNVVPLRGRGEVESHVGVVFCPIGESAMTSQGMDCINYALNFVGFRRGYPAIT